MLIRILQTGQIVEAAPSVPPGYYFSRHGMFTAVDAVPINPPDPPAIASDGTPSTTDPAIASESEDEPESESESEDEPPSNAPKPKRSKAK